MLRKLSGLTRASGRSCPSPVPASQNDYWALIFHADSLMDDGLYYLAATKDRSDIREGRPQKYGTQFNCLLLDSLRVNEWRQEVGLPPMEIKK